MDTITLRDMFCTECSLQFDKIIVYDLHLSLVHRKRINIKQEPNNCELTSVDAETKAIETCIILSIVDNKITFMCFEKKIPDEIGATAVQIYGKV